MICVGGKADTMIVHWWNERTCAAF